MELLARFDSTGVVLVSMFALTLATLTTNMAANIVSPATSFSNILPKVISLRTGAVITGVIGILLKPWVLLADPNGYIFTMLIGFSALLGPIGGILIADYFVVRSMELSLVDLYKRNGQYTYKWGFNPAAMVALVVAIGINIPGFLNEIGKIDAPGIWSSLYHYAWFIGFATAFALYILLMKLLKKA